MEELIEKFIEYIKLYKDASDNTIISYRRDIRNFKNFILQSNIDKFEDIKRNNILDYVSYLETTGKSPSTISRNIASLRAFFQYLYKQNIITSEPTNNIESPRFKKKLPEILSLEKIELLLEQPNTNETKGIRDRAMLEVLYATGIKVTELTSLKIQHVNLSLGYIKFPYQNKERLIPLGSKAISAIKKYIDNVRYVMIKQPNEDTLFVNCNGTPMTRQGFWKIIKVYARRSDICDNITPHILRHSFATHLMTNGADLQSVSSMLGHSDVSTTKVYEQKIKEVYLKAHPRA